MLADEPEAVGTVSNWYFNEWASRVANMTVDKVKARLSQATCRNNAPMLILAKDRNEIIGAAELKNREMDIYPDYEHWIGGVYVVSPFRGQGIASKMVKHLLGIAKNANIKKLYLQTEKVNGGLYAKLGFKPIEEVDYGGRRVLVMVHENN